MQWQGFAATSDLAHRSRIERDVRVGGEKRHAFGGGLGNKQSVERLLVDGWQGFHAQRVFSCDRQLGVPVVEQTTPQQMPIHKEVRPTQASLDDGLSPIQAPSIGKL